MQAADPPGCAPAASRASAFSQDMVVELLENESHKPDFFSYPGEFSFWRHEWTVKPSLNPIKIRIA